MATLFMNADPAAGKKEEGKSRGRKPTKGATLKKSPQRGMGVEKLERLRIQERWKKMTEAATAPQLDQSGAASYGAKCPTVHLAESSGSVPMLLGAASYGVPTINVGVPVGLWGWDMGMKVQQRTWNGGFGGDHGTDQVLGMVDYSENRAKAQDLRVQFGSVLETSKELSSMPNLQQYVPEYRCEFCFKKKRLCGENRRLNGGLNSNQTSHVLSINGGPNLPRQHLENNQNFNGLINNGFRKREPRSTSAAYSNHNLPEGVEVVAIHRRRINSSMGSGNQIFMEYDFFPRRSTSSKVEEASVTEALGGEASSDTNSTFVDLSLKLSY